jgi:hypothetical protein
MTPAEYRAKAEQLLAEAQLAEPKGRPDMIALAISYLRLADLAEKNAGADLVYETPPVPETPAITVPMQQQPQAEQQAQQAAKPEPSDEQK